MRMYQRVALCLGIACLLAASCRSEDYEILFDRPQAVGDHYLVHAVGTSTQHMHIIMDGVAQPKRDQETHLDVQAAVEVKAVNAKGKATKLRMVIVTAMSGEKAPSDQLLPPDAVVVEESMYGKTTFSDDQGNPYPMPVQLALNVAFSISDGTTTDDQIYGTSERKQVGDRWPIAVKYAAKQFKEKRMTVDPSNCTGTVTFLALVTDQGMECERIASDLHITDMSIALPAGVKVTTSQAVGKLEGFYPTDIKRQHTKTKTSMNFDMQAAGNIGLAGQLKAVTLTMAMVRTSELTFTAPGSK